MNEFFGETFINEEQLKQEGIKYPIKLEYYKRTNEINTKNKVNKKYGIDIVKIEYLENNIKKEIKEIKNISNDEEKINEILTILKRNEVTPIGAEDIIRELKTSLF